MYWRITCTTNTTADWLEWRELKVGLSRKYEKSCVMQKEFAKCSVKKTDNVKIVPTVLTPEMRLAYDPVIRIAQTVAQMKTVRIVAQKDK